jgi:transcriptional regulator with XRE-family HTH domain
VWYWGLFSIANNHNEVTMAREMPKRLGEKLRAIRLHKGWTLEQMAEAVGRTDTSRRSRVWEWEQGVRQPDYASLLTYARLVGVSTDDLIDDGIELDLDFPEG